MKRAYLPWRLPIFLAAVLAALFMVTLKPVFIRSGGKTIRVFTHALTVSAALQEAGILLADGDRVEPHPQEWVAWGEVIEVRLARRVAVARGGVVRWAAVADDEGSLSAGTLVERAGFVLEAGESVLADGRILLPEAPPPVGVSRLDLARPVEVLIAVDGEEAAHSVVGPSVAEALWQAGVRLHPADAVSPPAETLLPDLPAGGAVVVTRAREFRVTVDGAERTVFAAGPTVGEALARAGFPLTGLDYTDPEERAPLPADGRVRIVRVREEILREQSPIPFQEDTQPVADLELDRQKIVSAGLFGIQESAVRVRYEDGVEVSRTPLGSQVLLPPQNHIFGYGTKVVTRTFTGAGGPFTYWRAVSVFATSYSPCRSAGLPGVCYPRTATGKDVRKGVIAVTRRWFNYMRGQPVYVAGYGYATIEDIGAGKKGMYWIDLGYTDEEYEIGPRASGWTTVYFLEPIPSSILYIL